MKRVAVIGGGISGLSAAFYLEQMRRGGAPLEYVLYESSSRLGGVIRTEHVDGYTIEAGPDSFLSAKPWAADLARDAGIGDQLLPSNDHRRKTYILDRGRLVPMPDGMQMMVPTKAWPVASTRLFSPTTKLKMLRELVSPPKSLPDDSDESVANFVTRHFGVEVVTKLASPLLAGIYGSDAHSLSARAALPGLVALEAKHRSLVRGTLRTIRERASLAPHFSLFTSFNFGMQQLVDGAKTQLGCESLRLQCEVRSLAPSGQGWEVSLAEGTKELFEEIILALPSYAASQLCAFDSALKSLLETILYTDSITVVLAYSCERMPRSALPAGFGFLVPRGEGKKMIACTFVHNKFDFRAEGDRILLRVFLTSGMDKSDSQLITQVESELASILGIKSPIEFGRVYRWPRAMPQYEVGHLKKVEEIAELASKHKGLQLIGNAYRGIGIPDCVREGKLAAEKVLAG